MFESIRETWPDVYATKSIRRIRLFRNRMFWPWKVWTNRAQNQPYLFLASTLAYQMFWVKGIEIDFSEKVTLPCIFFFFIVIPNARATLKMFGWQHLVNHEVINWHSHWIVFIVKFQKNASETQSYNWVSYIFRI